MIRSPPENRRRPCVARSQLRPAALHRCATLRPFAARRTGVDPRRVVVKVRG
jgi:hypothetical protein